MGAQNHFSHHQQHAKEMGLRLRAVAASQGITPPQEEWLVTGPATKCQSFVSQWIEVWDYVGGTRFRGFTATDSFGVSALFIFFDANVVGKDLKQGLMALLELASAPGIVCSQLVVCLSRDDIASTDSATLLRDLGWVGFEPLTLDQWAGQTNVTSTEWLLLGMEV